MQPLPHTRLSRRAESGFAWLHGIVSWVWPALMVVIVVNVVARYLFGDGRVELEELQWHLYATGFLLGFSTCLDSDSHVRVDVFHARMSPRLQAWIELYGLILLLGPFLWLIGWYAIPFVAYSFSIGEVSNAPGGLPFRWIIKSMLPLAVVLLTVAAVARLSRVMCLLFGWPHAVSSHDNDTAPAPEPRS